MKKIEGGSKDLLRGQKIFFGIFFRPFGPKFFLLLFRFYLHFQLSIGIFFMFLSRVDPQIWLFKDGRKKKKKKIVGL